MLWFLSRSAIRMLTSRGVLGPVQCSMCSGLVEPGLGSALSHLERDHPGRYHLLIVGVVGISLAAAIGQASTRRHG